MVTFSRNWYLEGALHKDYGRLRSAKLKTSTAGTYWDRFCLFVKFVDEQRKQENSCKSVAEYMAVLNVEAYFHMLATTPLRSNQNLSGSSLWVQFP